MARFQLKRRREIVRDIISRYVVRAGALDVASSGKLMQLISAISDEINEAYLSMNRLPTLFSPLTARGPDLDETARLVAPGRLQRGGARRAVGRGRLTYSTAPSSDETIRAGFSIKSTTSGVVYTSIADMVTSSGSTVSSIVPFVATVPGEQGNTGSSSTFSLASRPTGVSGVEITSPFQNGRLAESDEDFQRKILGWIDQLTSATDIALETAVLGLEDPTTGSAKTVVFAKAVTDIRDRGNVTLYIDDGNGTAGADYTTVTSEAVITAVGGEQFARLDFWPIDLSQTFTLVSGTRGALESGFHYWLNPATGELEFDPPLVTGETITANAYTYFTGLIAEAQKVVDGVATDRANYPGVNDAGILVRVLSPQIRQISVVCTLSYEDGVSDRTTVATSVKSAVVAYINTLGISGDVILNEIRKAIMCVPGVYDVDIQSPSSNITILDNELSRSTTALITVN